MARACNTYNRPIFISYPVNCWSKNWKWDTHRLRFFMQIHGSNSGKSSRKELKLNQCKLLFHININRHPLPHTRTIFRAQNYVKSSIKSTLQYRIASSFLWFGISIFRFYIFYSAVVILLAAKMVAAFFCLKAEAACGVRRLFSLRLINC